MPRSQRNRAAAAASGASSSNPESIQPSPNPTPSETDSSIKSEISEQLNGEFSITESQINLPVQNNFDVRMPQVVGNFVFQSCCSLGTSLGRCSIGKCHFGDLQLFRGSQNCRLRQATSKVPKQICHQMVISRTPILKFS